MDQHESPTAPRRLTEAEIEALPERERWLWRNPEALASLERGIAQAAAGQARYIGSFAQHADDEI